ncbi:MAG: hypothetical protein K6D02_08725 [Lachnospiraceae bacterium]|nr:hypothetical protein [Lachnospiraceae bacterium]
MKNLVLIRKFVVEFYQKHNELSNLVFRFIFSLFTLIAINQLVGYNPLMKSWYIVFLVSLIFAFLPVSVMMVMVGVYAVVNVYYVSVSLAIVVAIMFLLLYLTYLRLDTNYTFIIPLVLVLHMLKLKMLIPIILGLFFTPITVVPMLCGILLQYLLNTISDTLSGVGPDANILYGEILNDVMNNKEMYEDAMVWIAVLLVIFFIKRIDIDYASSAAVIIGTFVGMTLNLLLNYYFEIEFNLGAFLIEMGITLLVGMLLQFGYRSLNYAATERLSFEDDEYIYYVKAVPKTVISAEERNVTRFEPRRLILRRSDRFERLKNNKHRREEEELNAKENTKDIILEEVAGKDPIDTSKKEEDK